jgi:hypothetical protein
MHSQPVPAHVLNLLLIWALLQQGCQVLKPAFGWLAALALHLQPGDAR